MAAVVVVERLVDRKQDRLARRVERRSAVGARVRGEHGLKLAVVAGVVQEYAPVARELRIEGHAEQTSLAAVLDARSDVDELAGRGDRVEVLEGEHATGLLDDEPSRVVARRLDREHRVREAQRRVHTCDLIPVGGGGGGGGGGGIAAPSPPPSQPPTMATASNPRIAGRRLTGWISSPISAQRPALNQDAAIHDHGHPRRLRARRCGFIDHVELQPERREPEPQAIVDDRGDVFGASEDVDNVDGHPARWASTAAASVGNAGSPSQRSISGLTGTIL